MHSLFSPINHSVFSTPQVQSVRCAELLVEFCRRRRARCYPVARGSRCGSASLPAGAAVGAWPREDRNRVSLRTSIRPACDAAVVHPLSMVRGAGCHLDTRSVQRLFLPFRGDRTREMGTASKTIETSCNDATWKAKARPRRWPAARPLMLKRRPVVSNRIRSAPCRPSHSRHKTHRSRFPHPLASERGFIISRCIIWMGGTAPTAAPARARPRPCVHLLPVAARSTATTHPDSRPKGHRSSRA